MAENEVKVTYKAVNAEFNSGIQSMNQAITSLNKEFGVQKEQMKLTASSSEKYEAELAKLNKEHEIAVQKTKLTAEAYENAKRLMGENSKEAQQWGNKLLDAERNEARLGNAITVANGKLAESKASMSETAQASERNKQAIADLEAEQRKLGAESQKLNSELKLEQSALSSSATEAEKLESAKKGLGKQSELVGRQIENLEKQLDLTKKEYGENSEEALKLESALNQAKTSFNTINKEMDNLGKSGKTAGDGMEQVNNTLRAELLLKFSEKLADVSQKLIDIGRNALEAFKQVDEGLDTVATKTGASGEALGAMQDIAKEIATTVPTDFKTAGSAVGEVNTQFKLTGDNLKEVSEQIIKFAEINGSDVTNSTINAKRALESYGLSVDYLGETLDEVTYISQNTGVSVDTIFQKATQLAPQIKSLGLSFDEGASLVGKFEQNGLDSTAVMGKMTKAAATFAKKGLTMKEGLAQTVEKIKNATTETEALNAANEVFGNKGGQLIVDAIQRGALSFEDLGEAASKATDTVSETYDRTIDPIDRFKVAQNNVTLAMSAVGDAIAATFAPAMEGLSNIIKGIGQWFEKLPGPVKQFAVTLGGVLTVAGVIAPIFLSLKFLLGALGATLSGVIAAAAPIIATIAGIAAAIAGLVVIVKWLWENNEGFREGVIAIWEGLQEFFATTIQAISDVIQEVWSFLTQWWEENQETIITTATTVWESVSSVIQSVIQAISDLVTSVFGTVIQWWNDNHALIAQTAQTIWTTIQNVWNGIVTTIQNAMTILMPYLQASWNTISSIVSTVWGVISGLVSTAVNTILGTIKAVMQLINGDWSGAWNTIKSTISTAWASIQTTVSTAINAVSTTFSNVLTGVKTTATNIWEGIKTVFTNALNALKNMFNFSWSLPSIPLPHFSITGKFSLNPPSIPHIGVEWYAKGGIMRNPTLFGRNGGNAMIGGEAGPEAILPLNPHVLSQIGRGIAEASQLVNNSYGGNTVNITANVSSDYDVYRMIDIIDDQLGDHRMNIARGTGG
nr:MAG TPA: Minor tail protein [Caudoviricetes sp.]